MDGVKVTVRKYGKQDIAAMTEIWNEIVDAGIAFPQTEMLSEKEAADFFAQQSFTGVAEAQDSGELLGLYILHPNNIGRCGHIANASYAVRSSARGCHIGEKLVTHSLEEGKRLGFRVLQFNAVVKTNHAAVHLYEKLGFVKLGTIPEGFFLKDGTFEDIILFYHTL